MPKPAFVLTVSVHIKMAGKKGVSGSSSSTTLVGEHYPDVKCGERAIAELHEARAKMMVKWGEYQMVERLQTEMFAEMK